MRFRTIRTIKYLPLVLTMKLVKCKKVESDLNYFLKEKNIGHRNILAILKLKEFRSILYYRYTNKNKLPLILLVRILSILYKPQSNLYITCEDIGDGLFIQHGFSTIISAKKIGKNVHLGQQTTIGWAKGDAPILGDNIFVGCNSTIIGGINIESNVFIGAGSVINKNVPANCTVVGNPATIVKKDGQRVKLEL